MRSAELAAEMTELYWMALARDLPFERYGTDPLIADAARELGALSGYRGPTTANGSIAPEQLFRGGAAGCLTGPYLSQFMLQGMRFGTVSVDLRQQTLRQGLDYMSDPAEWLAILRGNPAANGPSFEATERYPITLRDLAAYVRVDELYQAYLLAALRLVDLGVPMAPGFDAYQLSPSCEGYVTFGNKHVLGLVAEVAQRALAAVWYSKWFVHRRARPEILGGRVEWQRRGRLAAGLHPDLMQSEAVRRTLAAKGSALLPQAYPDGAPLHPSYGAGHATVAAACTAVLKAVFDPSTPIQNPVVPDSAGTNLLPYTGPDANALTVGGELDKLAANISLGRNAAGIHYRSDHEQSSLLGERIAAAFLGERSLVYREAHRFEFPSVSGSIIRM